MSLVHPIVARNANPPTSLPDAFDAINAALRALDGADTLVVNAETTALDSVLSRLPQVLAVYGTPSSLDGGGRYALRLPSNGDADQTLIVANRTSAPLRLLTADGANALVAALPAGRIEAFALSGSTIGAYALSSARTGKANTSHAHTLSDIADIAAVGQIISAHRNVPQTLTALLASPAAYQINTILHNSLGGSIDGDFGLVVPVSGLYRIGAVVDGFSSSIGVRAQISINGGAVLAPPFTFPPRTTVQTVWTPPISLAANDSVRLMLSLAYSGSQEIGSASHFTLERIR